jgi:hypothetical protein
MSKVIKKEVPGNWGTETLQRALQICKNPRGENPFILFLLYIKSAPAKRTLAKELEGLELEEKVIRRIRRKS